MAMLINISLTGSILILLVLAVRPLLKKAPRWMAAGLWLLPFGRLLLPYSGVFAPVSALPQGLTAFWIIGVAALLLYAAGTALYLYRLIQGAVEYEDRVFVRDGIESPFALGKKIYMPFEEDTARRTWLVRQYRRRSTTLALAVRCAVFAAAAVHWFNPLVWVTMFLSRRDWDAYHDDAVLREASLLPCAVAAPPMWLRLCPWAAFQTGITKRRAACEEQTASAGEKRLPAAILAGIVAVAAALSLVPSLPQVIPTAGEPLWINGVYYVDDYTYRSPLTAGLAEVDRLRYDFSGDRLVIHDKLTGDTVQDYPLEGLAWQTLPYSEAQWGRLLWWVEQAELPYLDARYVCVNSSMALLKTENGLYLLRGSMLGTGQDTITSICALTTEQDIPTLNTKLPEGLYVSAACVSSSPYLSSIPSHESGFLYYFKEGSVKIVEKRNGAISQLPVEAANWKHLQTMLDKKDYDWMARILGGYDALQQASFYQLADNCYLILSGEKVYIGHGGTQEYLNSINGGHLYRLQSAPASAMPTSGHSVQLTPATYYVRRLTYFEDAEEPQVRPWYIEITENRIVLWYEYDTVASYNYDPTDGQWIYFPEVTSSTGSKYVICLSDAYVRELNRNEFLMRSGDSLYYGTGAWDEETGYLQIHIIYDMNRSLTNPYKPK